MPTKLLEIIQPEKIYLSIKMIEECQDTLQLPPCVKNVTIVCWNYSGQSMTQPVIAFLNQHQRQIQQLKMQSLCCDDSIGLASTIAQMRRLKRLTFVFLNFKQGQEQDQAVFYQTLKREVRFRVQVFKLIYCSLDESAYYAFSIFVRSGFIRKLMIRSIEYQTILSLENYNNKPKAVVDRALKTQQELLSVCFSALLHLDLNFFVDPRISHLLFIVKENFAGLTLQLQNLNFKTMKV